MNNPCKSRNPYLLGFLELDWAICSGLQVSVPVCPFEPYRIESKEGRATDYHYKGEYAKVKIDREDRSWGLGSRAGIVARVSACTLRAHVE